MKCTCVVDIILYYQIIIHILINNQIAKDIMSDANAVFQSNVVCYYIYYNIIFNFI